MNDRNLAILYEMALLMGSETDEPPLIRKFLQRLLYHTGMPTGFFMTGVERLAEQTVYTISDAIAGADFKPDADRRYTLPFELPTDSCFRQLNDLSEHLHPCFKTYQYALVLPVGLDDAFVLFTPHTQQPLPDQLFTPILANFAKTLRLYRSNAQATATLRCEIEERRKAEQMLKLVLDHIPAGVYWQDTQGNLQGVNRWLMNDLLHQAETEQHSPDLSHLQQMISIRQLQQDDQLVTEQGQQIHNKNYYLQRSDDSFLWVELNKVPIRDASHKITGLLGTYRDITGRKLMMEELLHAKENAEQANRAKSSFLASMSHELRTPLNAIQGYTQLMEMDEEDLTEEHIESLQEIRKASNHLLQLIDEVLDLSKIEAGRVELKTEPVNPIPLIQETLTLNKPMADGLGVSLISDIPMTSLPLVMADGRRLKQILLNFVSNGIKYNKEAGQVRITLDQSNREFRLHVTDTGFGLTSDQINQLFQPFERLEMQHSSRQGTGIGLVISKKLAEAMHGRIEVQSTPGEGSTFTLVLPVAEGSRCLERPAPGAEPSVDDIISSGGEKTTTLYVEDNPTNRLLVEKIFSKRPGDRLITAATPEEGLEALRAHTPELVILDINLPGMSGFDMLRHIRSEGLDDHRHLVALSANAMPEDIERGKEAGFEAYLTKPIHIPEFNRLLNQWLKTGKTES